MQDNRLSHLLQLYAANNASKAEIEEMFRLLDKSPDARELLIEILADRTAPETIATPIKKITFTRRWLPYAAAIILLVTSAAIYYFTRTNNNISAPAIVSTVPSQTVVPGTNKAILTLSNGKKIELNNTGSATIKEGQQSIKNNNGVLAYSDLGNLPMPSMVGVAPGEAISHNNPSGPGAGVGRGANTYNTMSTPSGGQYQLVLPDGSRIWLNAASSITFPTAFNGATRQVTITGEAYLDIKKDAAKPFIVITKNQRIEVLGTEFNINAYEDEPAAVTSLIAGKIKINETILVPGKAYTQGKVIALLPSCVSWKNGYFQFKSTPLPDVLRQLSRWYDITITYPRNKIPDIKFDGRMGRNLQFPQVLRGLQQMGVQFKMEGKNLIVL